MLCVKGFIVLAVVLVLVRSLIESSRWRKSITYEQRIKLKFTQIQFPLKNHNPLLNLFDTKGEIGFEADRTGYFDQG